MHAAVPDIVLVEPWFTTTGHISFNRAFLAIVRAGFPEARITFACPPPYRDELIGAHEQSYADVGWIDTTAWTQSTTNGGIGELWHRARWLTGVLGRVRGQGITPTHLIILGSSGPLLLAAFAAKMLRLPKSCRTFAVLHGANELFADRRQRNPLRRLLSFRNAMRSLPTIGIRAIALEAFIAEELRKRFPSDSIRCIPHGCDETESLPEPTQTTAVTRLRVLFLGQATPHKGFAEFARLAQLAQSANAQIEFRAAGAARRDTRHIDQSALSRRAGDQPLERSELLAELASTHLVFTWQSEHYDLTPSGMLLDCIGFGVPLVGRRSRAIAALEAQYGACGLFAKDIESTVGALMQLAETAAPNEQLSRWRENLLRARVDRSARVLGTTARRELDA